MAGKKDYYQILGVAKTATADEIKRAYRKLALEFHPDRNKTKEADARFKEVTKAYEVLSDQQKRSTYDQIGHSNFEQGAGGGGQGPFGGAQSGQQGPFRYTYSTGDTSGFDFGGFSDPFDIFEQFFGGASPYGGQKRRQTYSLNIDFMEAVSGVEKKVTINGKSQTIKIPAGVDTGSRIRFNDFDVVLDVLPSREFKRTGADVLTNQEISFADATLGTTVSVKTLRGTVQVKIPAGTQPDAIIRLREKGIPKLRSTTFGDHYLQIKVSIPKHLTARQKQLLEEFAREKDQKKSWF